MDSSSPPYPSWLCSYYYPLLKSVWERGVERWEAEVGIHLPVKADLEAKQLAYDGISEKGGSFTTVGVAYAQDSNGNIQRLVSMNSNSMSRWGYLLVVKFLFFRGYF